MKKYLLCLFAFLASFSLTAQAAGEEGNTVTLGYCNGQAASDATIQIGERGWLECGLRLPASALQNYAGGELKAIRAAIVSRMNTDSLIVWVRKDLNGENLAEKLIRRSGTTPTVQQGWNEVWFDEPYRLPAEAQDLFVGFSIYQKTGVKIISQVQPPVTNTSYYRFNGGTWNDISGMGVLSIEALVGGDNLPDYELGFLSASISPAPGKDATAMNVQLTAHNYGLQPVSAFRVKTYAPGIDAVEADVVCDIPAGTTQECSFSFDPGVESNEYTDWTVELVSISGGEDAQPANNTVKPAFSFLRNVLIEEFTTLRCPNCPSMATFLHDFLAETPYADRISVIAHHTGYYTDMYTVSADYDYLGFYTGGSTYAPSLMMNRRPIYPEYDNRNNKVTNFIPGSYEEMQGYTQTEVGRGADVVMGMSLAYNADSTRLTVTVDARKNSNYATPNPYINVFLLEDDVYTRDQSGAYGDYYLQHITRGYNSSWGTAVAWDQKNFTYTYSFDLDPGWAKENMEVVSFIYNYDYYSFTNREVDNCVRVKLADAGKDVTGIRPAVQPQGQLTEVGRYDLSGRPVTKARKGVQVVRFSDGTSKKVVVP
ncbi:MAG: Omp28-related outer membrane protein [Alloprevotella sp.]|nr:Omp28-related outer membrane protein [Alloprevotella sp.]